ncbi:MAG: hypothetical protein Q4B29_01295 [Candidatus Saccharibacteria bacterium]|nr:hypothetical protein [Candidatus Saccharibacteria bacterium]
MRLNVKNTTFPGLLDLLAPHSCRGCGHTGEALCDCCKNNILKQKTSFRPKEKLPKTFIVGKRDGLLNDLIHDFKYNSNRSLAKPLAELLAEKLPKNQKGKVVVVPLPTATNHIRTRAFDHTLLLAKHLARFKGYQVEELLVRTKNTVQVGADEKTRLKQAREAFELNPKLKIDPETTYLILDDVWTTGASMKSAIKKLRQGGAKKLIVGVLAVNRLD